MARTLTTGFTTEIEAKVLRPGLLVKAQFTSGDVRLWTGIGDLTFNSEVYTGASTLLKVTRVTESKQLVANSATFELSGVDSAIRSLALSSSEHYQNNPISAWFAAFDTDRTLIADPYMFFSGKMDTMELTGTTDNPIVKVSAESDLTLLRKAKERRYTPEDQKQDYPDDLGYDYVPLIQDIELTWGAGV